MNNEKRKTNIIYPDYNNCILNLINSILKAYNVPLTRPSLKQINCNNLSKKKNIILFIFDGLGYKLLKTFLNDDNHFLKSYLKDKITTLFPSTTASIITSIKTALSPYEHGILGWALFFKEYVKLIDILPMIDDVTFENINHNIYNPLNLFSIDDNIFKKINRADKNVKLISLYPEKLKASIYTKTLSYPSDITPYSSTKELFEKLKDLINNNSQQKKFIFVYSMYPDAIMHTQGVHAKTVYSYIKEIDKQFEHLANDISKHNSSIFITADHGLIDVENHYCINNYESIYNSLVLPPFPEPRFVSLFFNSKKNRKFEKLLKTFDEDFIIMKKDKFLRDCYVNCT